MVGCLELLVEYFVMEVAIAPGVTPNYVAWWIAMCTGSLGLDKLGNGSDDSIIPPLEEEDHSNVDNPIHDGPPLVGVLEVLAVVGLAPGKKDSSHSASLFSNFKCS